MAEIIPLAPRLRDGGKAETLMRKRKLAAVRSMVQRVRDTLRCEKCFRQLNEEVRKEEIRNLRVPYRFCDSCAEEYIDYIERLQGRGNPNFCWHNEAWMKVWQKWIDYQGSVDQYVKTEEFRQLMREIDPPDISG